MNAPPLSSIRSLDAVRGARVATRSRRPRFAEQSRDFDGLEAITVENCGRAADEDAQIRRSAAVGRNDLDSLLELIADVAIEASARGSEVEDAA